MQHRDIKLASVVSMPFDENTYIASMRGSRQCLVFDPGLQPDKIVEHLESEGLTPAAILNTHGHSDHIGGNRAMKERWPDCPLVIGAGDAPKLTDPELNLSAPFGMAIISPQADLVLREGETYSAAGIELEVLETPGHSCGHIVFIWKGGEPWIVFGGDVLFQGSIGRTDFPDGSFQQLRDAIHSKLFSLPGDTIVLPGHGPPTTVEEEIASNQFVGIPAGYQR